MSDAEEGVLTTLPWRNSETWKLGDWYPMPIGFHARNQAEYIIDGYGIFQLDETHPAGDPLFGDIECVPFDGQSLFTFATALQICEMHNQRKLL